MKPRSVVPSSWVKVLLTIEAECEDLYQAGRSREVVQEHARDRLVTWAGNMGLIAREEDTPRYQLSRCPLCRDDGWQQTTEIVRGVEVEVCVRCSCKPIGMSTRETDQAKAVEKVASGWSKGFRR